MVIEGGSEVVLYVDGTAKLAHSLGEPLIDGSVGLGVEGAVSHFDDVVAKVYTSPAAVRPLGGQRRALRSGRERGERRSQHAVDVEPRKQ